MANARGSLEESADFARGGGSAAPDDDSDLASRRVRLAAEQSRLIQWAEANGKLGFRRTIPEFGRGGEHVVYFHRSSQRYFKAARSDVQSGYEKLAEGAFYDGRELFIFDLFPRNVIQTTSGDVFPIDPVIQRVTPEFAAFLRSNPTMINRGT